MIPELIHYVWLDFADVERPAEPPARYAELARGCAALNPSQAVRVWGYADVVAKGASPLGPPHWEPLGFR